MEEIQYVDLPILIIWKDEIVQTINSSPMTNENTGITSSVIAPIGQVKGDTITVCVRYFTK